MTMRIIIRMKQRPTLGDIMAVANKTITTTELAEELETDPRTLRRFLRSDASPVETVGKGHRYILDSKTTRLIRKQFMVWAATKGNATTPLKG